MMNKYRNNGFTLVEMAVVVFIIGLIATMTLAAVRAQMANAAIRATQGNQQTIKDALTAYLGQHRRLPCPDTDVTAPDGVENRIGAPNSACSAPFGLIPYQTLGLTRSTALDGWDNFFSYQVSNNAASPNTDWTITANFHEGNTGVITIKDRVSPTDLTGIVAVVISYGKDGMGAYTIKGTQIAVPDQTTQPDEFQNVARTTANLFYRREYTESPVSASNPGGPFDDVVMAISANDLMTPLIKDGVMQSALGAYATQAANIQDWVAAHISDAPTCAVPTPNALIASLPANLQVDPWGNTLTSVSPSSPFTYCNGPVNGGVCQPAQFQSSSTSPVFTLMNSAAGSALQIVAPTGTRMQTIYPFLSLTATGC